VALVLDYPFRTKPDPIPAGIRYRETEARTHYLFEFGTADELFSLITVKRKPMVLPKLGEGPPNPTEAHIARMKVIREREEAATAKRAAGVEEWVPPTPDSSTSDAARRFIASMQITFDMWHDGTGYDLNALGEVSGSERDAIETHLIQHQPRDWRDIEALAQIDSPRARQAIEAALKSPDAKVRREAMHHAGEKVDPADREKLLLNALNTAGLFDGLSEAIDEAAEFHPPSVIDMLLRGALNRDGEAAVHFAALLFYLHGKSAEPFDWNHRPFFLRFNTSDRAERKMVFCELCQTIGVDVSKYLRPVS
jgi:hypothetical protein